MRVFLPQSCGKGDQIYFAAPEGTLSLPLDSGGLDAELARHVRRSRAGNWACKILWNVFARLLVSLAKFYLLAHRN